MKTVANASVGDARDELVERLSSRLEKNIPILFLSSGGSVAGIAAGTCQTLVESRVGAERLKWLLTVSLVDERFGGVGHPDSNWQALRDAGLPAKGFTGVPIIQGDGAEATSFEDTVARFNRFLTQAVEKRADGGLYIVALFGIGADGHTAGILPESPAASIGADSREYACGYRAALFRRITITPAFFPHIDFAAIWANGAEKREAIRNLGEEADPVRQPAQVLKSIRESTLFTGAEAS